MEKLLVLSVLAEVLLISVILVIMGRRRFSAAKNKEISVGAFRTMDLAGANESVITASRNFENQFQMPMLFMFGVLFVLQFQLADLVFVLLAALYVALRLLHSVVHMTSNHVRKRFNLFLLSCVVLWAFWLRFAWLLV
ncbi:MAG: MAPEG family protein [Gammaproteobacteria bacterium]|nr:MAPEG family protein [Gammaproteobacteria bacterium]MBU2278359.1 MAPEG family protein [Gammaproteobacteria bacterium]